VSPNIVNVRVQVFMHYKQNPSFRKLMVNTVCRLLTLREERRLMTYENLVLRIHLGKRGSK